jgi:hypothetical protein
MRSSRRFVVRIENVDGARITVIRPRFTLQCR